MNLFTHLGRTEHLLLRLQALRRRQCTGYIRDSTRHVWKHAQRLGLWSRISANDAVCQLATPGAAKQRTRQSQSSFCCNEFMLRTGCGRDSQERRPVINAWRHMPEYLRARFPSGGSPCGSDARKSALHLGSTAIKLKHVNLILAHIHTVSMLFVCARLSSIQRWRHESPANFETIGDPIGNGSLA